MREDIRDQYSLWLYRTEMDSDLKSELQKMDAAEIEDAFYRNLAFGTGGLRGIIGAGTNRMNVYTVGKASQGLADYVNRYYKQEDRKVAISYDTRIKSELFARVTAGVLAANGIQIYQYAQPMPTPCLSFALRCLHCAAGVMITASHNPSQYNGYKVYGADGCQITVQVADQIYAEIKKLDIFKDIKQRSFEAGLKQNYIHYIEDGVYDAYIDAVKSQSVLDGKKVDKQLSIVYTPLNGTGLKPVLRVLKESGFSNVHVVKEQEPPDGCFPTCPFPNPENPEAMQLGLDMARQTGADLLLATDPDCDRVGIAARNAAGEYILLNGNETGVLLLDYICARRIATGTMPKSPVVIKTIVTSEMTRSIARHYGAQVVDVLTGFKFIGEQIGLLEREDKADCFLFAFEESCGYLSGTYVRDKDGVDGALLISEMTAWYKSRGISLPERLEELYRTYGYCLNLLLSYTFEGPSGISRMDGIMRAFREQKSHALFGKRILACVDYSWGVNGLPSSNVLQYRLQDNISLVIRPSGTEPKLKAYISIGAKNREAAQAEAEELRAALDARIL